MVVISVRRFLTDNFSYGLIFLYLFGLDSMSMVENGGEGGERWDGWRAVGRVLPDMSYQCEGTRSDY